MSNNKGRKRGLLQIVFSRTMLVTVLLLLNFLYLFSVIFDLFRFVPILFGSMVVFTAVMELVILNDPNDVDVKLTWAVVVAVLPVLGAVLYLFVRFDLGNRVNRKLLQNSILSSLPHIPDNSGVIRQIATDAPDLLPIARYLNDHAHAPCFTNTDVAYYPLGEDFFEALLPELEKAEKFIFMEYFLISEGYMWNSILEILERKAAAGVEVRFLYDGMNAFTNLPYSYPKELENMGIRCKMHAPVRPFISTHYNNRDHRKITVIDGHTAFTGGINLEDRYINIDSPYGHWKDTAIKLHGDAAQSFTLLFLQMWNATEREQQYQPYLVKWHHASHSEGYVIPYGDGPISKENVGETVYLSMINSARTYIRIMTPYLIPDEAVLDALKFAAKRGVDVQMILPGISDMRTTQIMAQNQYRSLMESGVKIYEYTPGFVHAKVFLCDDIHAVVGTINLDYRSLRHHFECGAYLYRLPVLEDMKEDFRKTRESCHRISPEDIRNFPRFQRFLAYLLKFAAPLL